VQLPGVQDPTQAERILGATATLEFRMVCENESAFEAEAKGRAPIGCELFVDRAGNPVLLKKKTIVSGDQLIDASQTFSEGRPAVSIRLDNKGSQSMLETTKRNLNKLMAVLFIQQRQETIERDGQFVTSSVLDKDGMVNSLLLQCWTRRSSIKPQSEECLAVNFKSQEYPLLKLRI